MHVERKVALVLLAFVVAACGGGEVPTANAGVRHDSTASRIKAKPMNQGEFIAAASKVAQVDGGEVVIAQGNEKIAAIVLYHRGDAEANPPRCALRLVEASSGAVRVVDSSSAIVDCSLDTRAEEVRAATKVAVGSASITLEKDSARGHEAFEIERGEDGVWYVTKVSYARSEEDAATGDMVAFIEEVAFAQAQKGIPLGKFSYGAIEKDLVRRVVE